MVWCCKSWEIPFFEAQWPHPPTRPESVRWRMLVGACVRATLTTASTPARSHNSVSFGQRLTAGGQYCVLYSTSDLKRGDLPREVSMGKMRGPGACGATFAYSFPLPNVLSKSFVSKTVVEKEGLPRDNPYGLGAGGPRFKSGRPTKSHRSQ